MDTFQSIEQLNQLFTNKQLDHLPKIITIGEINFLERDSLIPKNLSELSQGRKIITIYSPKAQAINKRLALVWGMKSGLTIVPLLAKLIGKYRDGNEESVMRESEKKQEPTIGTHIDIVLVSFNNNQPITGKVDTGATINSLHAENINIREDPLNPKLQLVDFVFEGKKYTVGLVQQQSVQSADGGIKYRPVVQFTVKYDGKTIPDVLFNLNDRGEMEDKLLIGMNLLQDIGYKIDPNKDDLKQENEDFSEDDPITEDEWAWIEEQINEDVFTLQIQEEQTTRENIHMLYEYLIDKNITFADLMKHVKQHTIKIVEHLQP